jgi:uroporphyrinogen-III synthase
VTGWERPLVVATRAEQAGDGFSRVLRQAGVNAVAMPTISIGPPQDPVPLTEALGHLGSTRWIVFTSAEAVAATCAHADWAPAWRSLAERPRIAAVGPATAARVRAFGLPCDLVPERSSGGDLAAALVTCDGSLAGAQVLWPRSDIAGRELPDALTAAGALVIEPEAYRTSTTQPNAVSTFRAMLEEGSVEAVAFFSPSAATGLARAFALSSGGALAPGNGSTLARLAARTEVASIGPSTSAALEALGAPVTIEAETRTGSELATAILRQLARRKGAA